MQKTDFSQIFTTPNLERRLNKMLNVEHVHHNCLNQ